MAKVSSALLFAHVQKYIREVYADQLRQAGFSSYRGEDIHWFRIVNSEVVHAVYFTTSYMGFPALLEIGYGCHPLFIPPVLQRSPYMRPTPGCEQMHHEIPELIPGSMPYGVQRSMIHGLSNKIYRVPDVMVSCPADEQTSRNILNKVLSVLEPIETPAACFAAHKRWRASQIENDSWVTMTPYFVDEVLYWEERSLYPYCMRYVNGTIGWLDQVMQDGKPVQKADREEYAHLIALKEVFLKEDRQAYLQVLHERELKNIRILKKSIPFPDG